MNSSLFSVALGRYLSRFDGLREIELPAKLPLVDAIEIALEANKCRPISPPYAIVVSELSNSNKLMKHDLVSPNDSIAYREGDRLAIWTGRSSQSASSASSFVQLLNQSFPADKSYSFDFDELITVLLSVIIEGAGVVQAANFDVQTSLERLRVILKLLKDSYEVSEQSHESWNILWFAHVNRGLGNLVSSLIVAEPDTDVTKFFEVYSYAAFSLPRPTTGIRYSNSNNSGRAIRDAMSNYWSSEVQVLETLAAIRNRGEYASSVPQLSDLSWSGYDYLESVNDSLLNAWELIDFESPQRIDAFANLTEVQFFSPVDLEASETVLRVENLNGESLMAPTPEIFVLEMEILPSASDLTIRTEMVRVVIPCIAEPSEESVRETGIAIESTIKDMRFNGTFSLERGSLVGVGYFEIVKPAKPFNFRVSAAKISVKVPHGDSLFGRVVSRASSIGYFVPESGPGCLAFPKNGVKFGKPSIAYPSSFDSHGEVEEGQESLECWLKKAGEYFVSCWGGVVSSDTPATRKFNLSQRGASNARCLDNYDGITTLGDGEIMHVGKTEIKFLVEEGEIPRNSVHASPIIAAIYKSAPSGILPEDAMRDSLRGSAETVFLDLIDHGTWKSNLGHIVLPQDGKMPLDISSVTGQESVIIDELFKDRWETNTTFSVPSELLDSEELEQFRIAFEKLKIKEALTRVNPATGESNLRWVSLTSWKHLWESRDELEAYLLAYSALVTRANRLDSPSAAAVFWATFPFSVSSWDSRYPPFKCGSVSLSPLHPLRLAWFSSTESTLYGASQASALAGMIEGWNFPYVSQSETKGGRLIAIPTDAGEQQVFIGWSMLVAAPVGEASCIEAPEFIGRYRSPGVSTGGLNGASVAGAIKEYRRMNAYAPTVTLDLAASSPGNRARDIDEAVITAMKSWTASDAEGVSGGIRVFDSLNRLGEAPREKLVELLGGDLDTPLTWSRYSPLEPLEGRSNLRLLQDAAVALNVVDASDEASLGVLGPVPIRRFEARDPLVTSGIGRSRPIAQLGSGWEPFSTALYLVEKGEQNPTLHTQLVGGSIVDGMADWTISGETLVNPAALAAMMKNDRRNGQMLWEWRPPFLEKSNGNLNQLDRRPYLSIVRVPQSFRNRVKEKLQSAYERDVAESDVDDLLGVLGARGVGLASLVAMGGTHATGALGFYAALQLMNMSEKTNVNRFVMPIDACDEFLWSLANERSDRTSRKRADLLLIEIDDERISLGALEIKYWGLEAANGDFKLPRVASHKVSEALEQASNTTALLRKLENNSAAFVQSSPDRLLWNSAFGALIESAMRLHPSPASSQPLLVQRLQKLVNGQLKLTVASPLLLILQQGAVSANDDPFTWHIENGSHMPNQDLSYGALIANPSALFVGLEKTDSRIVGKWKDLLDWAFGSKLDALIVDDDEISGHNNESENVESKSGITTNVALVNDQVGIESDQEIVTKMAQVTGVIREDGVKFPVGEFLGTVGSSEAIFWPGNTALNQMNLGIVGDLGTGKTQLLMSLIAKLRHLAAETQDNPLSMLILDYKEDFQSKEFIDNVGGKVIRPFDIPLNIFQLKEHTKRAAFQSAKSFVDVLSKIYGGIGPVQSNKLTEVIVSLYEDRNFNPPTMKMVLERYRDQMAQGDSIVGILNNFVMGGIFSDESDNLVPFAELLDNKVAVLALNQLGADQATKNALVVLFLNQYYEYMLGQTKWDFEGLDPQLRRLNSFLVIDEAHNIMKYDFPVLQGLLLQGRQFGIGVILSSQYLSHFKTSEYNYGQPLRSWFIHKVPSVTAQQLTHLGLPEATASDAAMIQDLANHQAYYSSLGVPGRFIKGEPFFEYRNRWNGDTNEINGT